MWISDARISFREVALDIVQSLHLNELRQQEGLKRLDGQLRRVVEEERKLLGCTCVEHHPKL
jgi:hypothetical protein